MYTTQLTRLFSSLTNRLLADVMHDYISKLKISPESVDGGIEVKYTKLLHTMRMRARKLLQFARYDFHKNESLCVSNFLCIDSL